MYPSHSSRHRSSRSQIDEGFEGPPDITLLKINVPDNCSTSLSSRRSLAVVRRFEFFYQVFDVTRDKGREPGSR
jgi:hypothetical protein